jgi:TATA-box binding protein (TBP) (component of TFIID and TFIIIB)
MMSLNSALQISPNNPYFNDLCESEIKEKTKTEKKFEPSQIHVSTMTGCAKICDFIDTHNLYKSLDIVECDDINNDISDKLCSKKLSNIKYPFLSKIQLSDTEIRPEPVEKKKKKKKEVKKKRTSFQNQLTVIVKLSSKSSVNIKLFKNGKIQMTGFRSEEQGLNAINGIIHIITNNSIDLSDYITDITAIKCDDFRIVMINSDFTLGFKVRREALYEILANNNIFVTYEPDIYPGVNTKFYFNSSNTKNGICNCKNVCNGKGSGNGDGDCKKVTIAIFQSGAIIITGSRSHEQMYNAYDFINKIISNSINIIYKEDCPSIKCVSEGNEEVYYISKTKIKNNIYMV